MEARTFHPLINLQIVKSCS